MADRTKYICMYILDEDANTIKLRLVRLSVRLNVEMSVIIKARDSKIAKQISLYHPHIKYTSNV